MSFKDAQNTGMGLFVLFLLGGVVAVIVQIYEWLFG